MPLYTFKHRTPTGVREKTLWARTQKALLALAKANMYELGTIQRRSICRTTIPEVAYHKPLSTTDVAVIKPPDRGQGSRRFRGMA